MNVGFIGLGWMGAGMARNLVKVGHHVTVFNRTPAKAELAPIREGAEAAASIAEACRGDAVVTMLANDEAVESLVLGRLRRRRQPAAGCSACLLEHDQRRSVAAPRGRAWQGRPAIHRGTGFRPPGRCRGGPALRHRRRRHCRRRGGDPSLEAFGQKTFVVLDTPKAANLVKLSGNFLIASVIESLGEALALVAKGGVDQRRYLEVLTSTLFDAPIYRTYGGLIAGETFEPAGFAAPLGQKDIRLALAAAEELRVPMPLASLLRDRFLTLLAQGGDRLDWSAIGGLAARDAGIRTCPRRISCHVRRLAGVLVLRMRLSACSRFRPPPPRRLRRRWASGPPKAARPGCGSRRARKTRSASVA